jgi:glycosyltransferase involved in cell wall biosynthesis
MMMKIIFIGPLPPPVHGFSLINEAMLQKLRNVAEVDVINRTPPQATSKSLMRWKTILQTITQLKLFISIARKEKSTSVYMGLSGGAGQLFDLPFLLLANIFKSNFHLHHHSFAYIRNKSMLTSIVFRAHPKANHIVLCRDMGNLLSEKYDIPKNKITVLSNIAYLPNIPLINSTDENRSNAVKIGFLSNITADKGIFEFFDLVKQANDMAINVLAYIAGPVENSIEKRFFSTLKSITNITYIGPVYNDEKIKFFNSIDLLLFPTRYKNEAEPVTVLEALRSGTSVIANGLGCIGGMIPQNCGSITTDERFISESLAVIKKFSNLTPNERTSQRHQIQSTFIQKQGASQLTLDILIKGIST